MMKGKIKCVDWRRLSYVMDYEMHRTGMFPNLSEIYAVTYPDASGRIHNINITKSALSYYGRERITQKLIDELNEALHNKWVSFSCSSDGENYLEGEIGDYKNI